MIDRNIDYIIENHFATTKTALLLTGARQTGKTFAIRKYAQKKGLDLVEVNFLADPEACNIFKDVRNAKDILQRLSAWLNRSLVPGKTLIFFDEIQRCKESVTMIKFLVDEGSFLYALSGSLLGVELNDIRSIPVGYMSIEEVYPLNLMEFAKALGVSSSILETLENSLNDCKEVDDVVHKSMMKIVHLYLIVGGMPAVVQCYLDTNDLNKVLLKQKEIVSLYRWDISQYDKEKKLNIKEIFDLIPSELDAKNKRFILKNLNEHARFTRYEDAFLWLKDAGVALPTYNVDEPRVPLKLSELRNLFKLFLNDVGLLASQYASGMAFKILSGETTINFGSIFENFIAQELTANGFPLYYFNSKKQGELDFILEFEGEIIPIEVKSGKDYERHNALKNVVSNKEYEINKAIVFCQDNIKKNDKVLYVPIYMIMFLKNKKDTTSQNIYKIDLTALS